LLHSRVQVTRQRDEHCATIRKLLPLTILWKNFFLSDT
jgi:hypothetical protein